LDSDTLAFVAVVLGGGLQVGRNAEIRINSRELNEGVGTVHALVRIGIVLQLVNLAIVKRNSISIAGVGKSSVRGPDTGLAFVQGVRGWGASASTIGGGICHQRCRSRSRASVHERRSSTIVIVVDNASSSSPALSSDGVGRRNTLVIGIATRSLVVIGSDEITREARARAAVWLGVVTLNLFVIRILQSRAIFFEVLRPSRIFRIALSIRVSHLLNFSIRIA